MQLVGAYKVFRLLLDIALIVGRSELWRDGGIDDIYQCIMGGHERRLLGYIAHKTLYEGLRNTGIDSIHRHVVAIIRCPTECQLRKVACTHYESIEFVGKVHQYLCTLARL